MTESSIKHLLVAENISLRYQFIEGATDKPYLVFLHEGLGCIEMWKDFPALLCASTGCPGLVYDRRGYGGSSPMGGDRKLTYLHEYGLEELPNLLQSVIPNASHIVVGHSDGATIGLIYGSLQEPLLHGIVAMAPHVFVEPETVEGVRLADMAYQQRGAGGLRKYHGDKTDQVFTAWADTWQSGWFREWNIEPLLPSITCPVLVFHGCDDVYGTKRQAEAISAHGLAWVELEILSNCGHFPHLEQSEIVVKRICTFLSGLLCGR